MDSILWDWIVYWAIPHLLSHFLCKNPQELLASFTDVEINFESLSKFKIFQGRPASQWQSPKSHRVVLLQTWAGPSQAFNVDHFKWFIESCHVPGTMLGPEVKGLEAYIPIPSGPCLWEIHTWLGDGLSHRWGWAVAEKDVGVESWIKCGGNTEEKRFLLSWGSPKGLQGRACFVGLLSFFVCLFVCFLFIFKFLAVLALCFCARAFSSCGERGPLFIVVRGPLTIVAFLAVEHRLQTRRLSSCGSRAQLLRGMWDLPRPGLKPVSPALAGRLSTTAPPGKPSPKLLRVRFGQVQGSLKGSQF